MAEPRYVHSTCDGGAFGVLPSGVVICVRCDSEPAFVGVIPNSTHARDPRPGDWLPPTARVSRG